MGVVEGLKGGGSATGGRGREMGWERKVGLVKLEWEIGCSAICTEWGWPCIGIDVRAILVVLHSRGSGRCRCSLMHWRSTVKIVRRKSAVWDVKKAVICSRLPLFCAGARQCRQTGGGFYVRNVAMGHGTRKESEGWRVGTRLSTVTRGGLILQTGRTVKGRRRIWRGGLGKRKQRQSRQSRWNSETFG